MQEAARAFDDTPGERPAPKQHTGNSWADAAMEMLEHARDVVTGYFKPGTSNDRKRAIQTVKRGMKAFNAKQYADAEELFRRAISRDPTYARAHAYLGNTLYKGKRQMEAMCAWQKAIEVEPGSDAADMAQEKIQRITKKTHEAAFQLEMDVMARGRG